MATTVPNLTEKDRACRDHGLALWLVGPGAGVAIALWLTAGAWGARLPGGSDTIGHLVRAQYALRLWEHGHLDGWLPRFALGAQEFLVYAPGFDLLVAGGRLLTLGLLSDAGAIKALEVITIAAMAPAGWYLARSFGFDKSSAAVASVFVVGVNSIYGVGPYATFVFGFVPNQAAAPLWCLAAGALWRLSGPRAEHPQLLRRDDVRDSGVAIASMAGLLLVHPLSALALGAAAVPAVAIRLVRGQLHVDRILITVRSIAIAAGLTGFWIVPFLAHRNLQGGISEFAIASWSTQLGQAVRGQLVFGPWLGQLAVAAAVLTVLVPSLRLSWVVKGSNDGVETPANVAWLAAGFFALAHMVKYFAPQSQAGLELGIRGLGYVGVMAVLPLAWWLTRLTNWFGPHHQLALPGIWHGSLAMAAAILVVASSYHWHQQAGQAPVPYPDFVAAAAAIRTAVPQQARIAVDRPPGDQIATGVPQPNLWVVELAGRNVLNVFVSETSASSGLGYTADAIHTSDPADMDRRLARLGVTDVLTLDPLTTGRYEASGLFSAVWSDPSLALLKEATPPGQPDPSTLLSTQAGGSVSSDEPVGTAQHLRWVLSATRSADVTVALAWSPKWHARVDGHRVPIGIDPDGRLIQVRVPAGAHHLALDFHDDGWDLLGRALTALTLVGTLATVTTSRWRVLGLLRSSRWRR